MIISPGIRISSGVNIIPENNITYTAGLYKTTYAGYFNDVVSFFATATPTTYGTNPATSVQTTAITEAASGDIMTFYYSTPTIILTATVTGRVFYNAATNGF